jgi:hypothetical protein
MPNQCIADQVGVSVKTVAAMSTVPDASVMLDLHAYHARSISQRAGPILWVAEQAAPAHPEVATLWAQSTHNRRTGAQWAAITLLAKPGMPPHISRRYAEDVFLDRHQPRHLPQPHPRPRPQPSRLRNLDQVLLPQNAPALNGLPDSADRHQLCLHR